MGRIFAVKRFEIHDGQGIRTTLFLQGCPLACKWCHNPEGMKPKPILAFTENRCVVCGRCSSVCDNHEIINGNHVFHRENCVSCGRCETVCPQSALTLYGKEVTAEEILPALLEDKLFYEQSGGGVTLSGGEPMQQAEFTLKLLKKLKENGISTALDTCGLASPEAYQKVLPFVDQILYDVKAIDSKVHEAITGQDNALILSNLTALSQSFGNIEVRVPYIPGMNDHEMEAIAAFLAEKTNVQAVKVLGYHELAKDKYTSLDLPFLMEGTTVPDKMTLENVRAVFRAKGLNVL